MNMCIFCLLNDGSEIVIYLRLFVFVVVLWYSELTELLQYNINTLFLYSNTIKKVYRQRTFYVHCRTIQCFLKNYEICSKQCKVLIANIADATLCVLCI